jgi:hypothetical protein
MKSLYLLIFIISLATACKKSEKAAPFTDFRLTAENMSDMQAGKNLRFFDFKLPDTLVITPIAGISQGWDYANVKTESISEVVFDTPRTNTSFPSAAYMYSRTDTFGVDTVKVATLAKVYVENSATGLATLGKSIDSVVLNYPGLQASIIYPKQTIATSAKIYDVIYPLMFGTAWSGNNITSTYNFKVNAPTFGLNNAAGTEVHTVSHKSEVTASGYMNLVKREGSFPVLVVKRELTERVNYLLNGSAAPAAFLSAVGLKDNVTKSYLTYSFYSPILGFVGTHYINIGTNTVERSTFRRFF